MPLFYESLESIAQAIVTVKRALKAGVIEKENYKKLEDYLNQRAKDFKIKKSHIAEAKRDLEDELQSEVEEFFMKKGAALYKMAEDILEDFVDEDDDEMLQEERSWDAKEADWKKQEDACKAWAKMNNEERAAMATLARNWQMSR
jgi:DNA-directed RNA polymerase specialized sigma subunit